MFASNFLWILSYRSRKSAFVANFSSLSHLPVPHFGDEQHTAFPFL